MQKQRSTAAKFSVNLRYLLWRQGAARADWSQQIAGWLACSQTRARSLLANATPDQREVDSLAEKLGVTSEELSFTHLIDELAEDLFLENLRFLVGSVEHGEKSKIASELGVHPTSLSRWIAGTHHPDKRYRTLLAQYFGLSSTDLASTPLFLSPIPVGDGDRRRWLNEAIENIDQRELNDIFPALFKLMTS